MHLNITGEIVDSSWLRLPTYFQVCLDEWVIMPNHLHGIILLETCTGEASADNRILTTPRDWADASPQRPIGTRPGSLGAIIQNFKSITSRKIHALYGRSIRQLDQKNSSFEEGGCFAPTRIWQRNYYERIIRNDKEWERIREYISCNPLQWTEDHLFG